MKALPACGFRGMRRLQLRGAGAGALGAGRPRSARGAAAATGGAEGTRFRGEAGARAARGCEPGADGSVELPD